MRVYTRLLFIYSLGLFFLHNADAQRVVVNQNSGLSSNVVVGQQFFHVSESIYTEQEIGAANFLTAAASIEKIAFFIRTSGLAPNIQQYRILMREVPSDIRALNASPYSQADYKQVFNGSVNMSVSGRVEIPLDSPFVRSSGKNLMVMIERMDSVQHFGFVFETSNGLEGDPNILSSRRYNDSVRPVLSSTILNSTNFRPAISFIRVFPFDVAVTGISHPEISCYNTTQTIRVSIQNQGLNTVNPGSVQVMLKLSGANQGNYNKLNLLTLQPGETEQIVFNNASVSAAGGTIDTAIISMNGDGSRYNDTANSFFTTASTMSVFPIQENMENTQDIFPYFSIISGNRQLWKLQTSKYSNLDMTPDTLRPQSPGIRFMLFDGWTSTNSTDFCSRMFSNCIQMPSANINGSPVITVSFIMSHDGLFEAQPDSLYLSVSNDRGLTWTRLQGFGRFDPSATSAIWTQHAVDISAYSGQTIQLGFEGVSKYGNVFGLDNIEVKYTNALPLTLLDFKAIKLEKTNRLIWTTSKEWNMDAFEIERSMDGVGFQKIGRIKSSGEGSFRTYEFEDVNPVAGIQYYRLKMLENNQSFTYSPVQKIDRTVSYEYSIINPVINHSLQMKLTSQESEKMSLVVTDLQGKKLMAREIHVPAKMPTQINVPLPLPSGTYLLIVLGKSESIQQQIVLP